MPLKNILHFVVCCLCVATFHDTLFAQNAAAQRAIFDHQMRSLEREAKLNELGADEMINVGGVVLPVSKGDSADKMNAIMAGCENFTPWIVMDEVTTGQIGRLRYPTNTSASQPHAIVEVTQVLGKSEFLGKTFGKTFWFKGIDTSNFTDGKELIVTDLLEVVGNKTYSTAVGTNTVMQLEVTPNCKTAGEIREKLTATPPAKNDNYYRTWTAKNGKRIVALLEGLEDRKLKFTKADGTSILVKRTELEKDSKSLASKMLRSIKKEAEKAAKENEKPEVGDQK